LGFWLQARKTRIIKPLQIREITQALQIKRYQELLRGHERIGSTALRRARPRPDQSPRVQPPNQFAADLLAEDVL